MPDVRRDHAPTTPPKSGADHRAATHVEIARLRDEIERLVSRREHGPRPAVDAALEAITRLQVVVANLDACSPPPAAHLGAALLALADRRLRGSPDAIERGITYTADNQLRALQDPDH